MKVSKAKGERNPQINLQPANKTIQSMNSHITHKKDEENEESETKFRERTTDVQSIENANKT